jgi:MSHA biogenesis protein MshQ
VGSVELYVRNANATSQIGQSGAFVVKPAAFVLSAIKCTIADAVNCAAGALPSGNNPGATTVAGPSFIRAGQPFSVTVTAVNSVGVATPNYGRETAPEAVKLTTANAAAGMLVPPPAVSGSFGAFASGAATGTQFTWPEVGIITLTPSVADGDYLGVGDVTGTISGTVGRFIPHHFDTVVTPGCVAGAFTYSGQPFTVQITAMNGATPPAKTQNYDGTSPAFAKAVTLSDANGAGVGTLAPPPPQVASTAFSAGVATVTTSTYTFTSKTTGPTTIKLGAVDTDSVSSSGFAEGTTEIRSGRVQLGSASGSALLPLRVPVEVQYWNGTFYVTHTADTCTVLTPANIGLGNAIGGVSTSVTAVSTLQSGRGTITLAPTAGGARGSIDLAVNLGSTGSADACASFAPAAAAADRAYLRGDWCGAPAKDPSARARFGIQRGSDETIYQRENFN